MGYSVLGLLIQQVSGQSYQAYMQTHLFAPLQMRQTFTDRAEAQAHRAASGHRYWFGLPVAGELAEDRASLPSGGVIASAEDVAHFLIAQLNGGRFNDTAILSAAGLAEMQRPIAPLGPDEFYAMDWGVGQIGDLNALFKGGAWADFKAQMILIPERRLGLVVLMNANKQLDTALGDRRLVMMPYNVAELLLGQPTTPFPADPKPTLLYATLFLVVAVQVGGMTRTVRLLWRWRRQPEQDLASRKTLVRRLELPLLGNLSWGLVVLLWPRLFGGSLSNIIYGAPDFGYTLLVSGVVALAWGIIRTVALLWLFRATGSRASAVTETPLRA
jgi:hypothetical protein